MRLCDQPVSRQSVAVPPCAARGAPTGRARLLDRRRASGHDLVLEAQVGAGIDCAACVELRAQGRSGLVLGLRGQRQQLHAQDAGRRVRPQVGVALEQRLDEAAHGGGLAQLRGHRRGELRLGTVGDHAQAVPEAAPRHGQRLQAQRGRQFAGRDMRVGRGARPFQARDVTLDRRDPGGDRGAARPRRLLAATAQLRVLAPQLAGLPPVLLERFLDHAHGRVHHQRGGLHLLHGVLRQRVETELLAQGLEHVLLRPPRAQQPGDLRGRQAGVRGEDRRLAAARRRAPRQAARLARLPAAPGGPLALIDPKADLAGRQVPVQQVERALGQLPAPRLDAERRAQGNVGRRELRLRPAHCLLALDPCHAGHAARPQRQEHLRTPALAVEDQRQQRILRWVRGGRRQQPQLLQLRQQVLPQRPSQARIDLLRQGE